MSWITSGGFWRDAAERAISSAAQGAIAGAGLEGLQVGPGASFDLYSLAVSAGFGALIVGVLTLLKCVATAAGTNGNPSIGQASVPGAQVLEREDDGVVVAGPANDQVPEGEEIRSLARHAAVED